MSPWLIALSSAVTLAWLPLIWAQWRRWRHRRHPVSASIISALAILCFISSSAVWVPSLDSEAIMTVRAGVYVACAVACVHFHVAHRRGDAKASKGV